MEQTHTDMSLMLNILRALWLLNASRDRKKLICRGEAHGASNRESKCSHLYEIKYFKRSFFYNIIIWMEATSSIMIVLCHNTMWFPDSHSLHHPNRFSFGSFFVFIFIIHMIFIERQKNYDYLKWNSEIKERRKKSRNDLFLWPDIRPSG